MADLSKLGSGTGRLFLTDPTSTFTWSNLGNTQAELRAAIQQVLASTPPITGQKGFFTVTISAVAAPSNITVLTVGGVSQITAPVAGVVGDPAATALALANEINATVSVPDYTAVSVGNVVYGYYQSAGTAPNGDVVALTVTAGMTATASSTVEGGADSGSVVSPTYGLRLYFNDDPAATAGPPTGEDITEEILSGILGRAQASQTVVDSSGAILVVREGRITTVEVDGTAANPNIGQVTMNGVNDGDIVIFYGKDGASGASFRDKSTPFGSVPNINTASASAYNTNSPLQNLWLMWENGEWWEAGRSSNHPISVADLRAAGIPQPIVGIVTQAVNFAGGTFTAVAGTTKGVIRLTGSGVLAGNYTVTGGGTPIAGETWIVQGYGSAVNIDGNNLVIFGENVPRRLAAIGEWQAVAIYDDVSATYRCTILANVNASTWVMDSMIDEVDGAKITAASIAAGTYGVSSINGATDILNGSIPATKLDAATQAILASLGSVSVASTTLTSARILVGNSIPTQVVSAPPTGYQIVLACDPIVSYTYGGAAYATNTDIQIVDSLTTTNVLASITGGLAVGTSRTMRAAMTTGTATTRCTGGISFFVPAGDPTAGTGSATLTVYYYTIPV